MKNSEKLNKANRENLVIATEFQLGNILDKMLEGMQIISFDWKYLYVNDALVKQGGYTKKELMGRTMMEMYPGLEQTDVFRALKECMESRIPRLMETAFVFPNSNKTWFELSIQPIDEGIFILSVDITARKLAEERFKTSESEYRALIDQATDGIFISDDQGKYIDVNLSACKMLGYSKEELLTMTVTDVLIKEDVIENPPRFDELRAGKNILSIRNFRRKDGTTLPVEINGKMLSNGKMLGMVRDITERKEAEELIRSSEEKFRSLTETAFDAIILMDKNGKIILWNRGAESIFGYIKEEVMYRSLTVIMPEKHRQAHEAGIARYLSTGEKKVMGRVIAMEGLKKNGDIFPIEISITSWDSQIGKIFSGIIRDSTERKEAENKILRLNQELEEKVVERTAQLETKILQLKESEEKFQKAFQASAAGISITKLSDATYLDVNEAFINLTGYTKEELLGRTSLELNLVSDIPKREQLLEQIRNHGYARQFEITIRNKSGKLMQVLSSVDTILLNGEKYALNIAYDITERKKAEDQLEAANKELEAFSYSISHDLRAPLRSITGYSKILEEDFSDKISAEAKNTLNIIQRNAVKMGQLIDNLLEFSRLGKKELFKSKIDTNKLVDAVISSIIDDRAKQKAHITIKPLLPTYADQTLLAQVWTNLISNSIKYSSKKAEPQIEIGCTEDQDEIVYYVKDNGSGFDMQYVHKLFEVFQRLHREHEFEGTGVGLSIVRRIINKHRGRVWAEGKLNEGATFYFTLPKQG